MSRTLPPRRSDDQGVPLIVLFRHVQRKGCTTVREVFEQLELMFAERWSYHGFSLRNHQCPPHQRSTGCQRSSKPLDILRKLLAGQPVPGAVRSFIEVHMPWHMHGFGEALDALNASVHRRSVLLVTVLREPVAHCASSWIYNGAQHCRECRTASDYVRAHPNLPATQLAQMRCRRQRARAPPA